jgi:peptidoglycan/LPS O-acetylase OafA/YrhL
MTAGAPRAGYLHGLDVLRVLAAGAVLYTHVANWFDTRSRMWWLGTRVDGAVIGPLHLNPNLSFVGVATFLVISGLVVTQVAFRETPGQFLRRRLVRILPALWCFTTVSWVLINLGWGPASTGQRTVGFLDYLDNLVLADFFKDPQVVQLQVTWTLLIQIVCYGFVAATIPLLRRQPWIPPALAATAVSVTLAAVSGTSSVALHRVGIIAAFLPALCIGQLISMVRSGRLHPAAGFALATVHFALFVRADHLGVGYMHTGTSYPRTLALVVLGVLLVMDARGPLATSPVVRAAAKRTYALYLVHETCVYPLLDRLAPRIGPTAALAVVILLVAVAVEALHRLVEMPVQNWLRDRRRAAGESDSAADRVHPTPIGQRR